MAGVALSHPAVGQPQALPPGAPRPGEWLPARGGRTAAEPARGHGLIGDSAVMRALFASLERFAPHARATLLTGETGTGKAAFAQALHRLGPRRDGAFHAIRCASLAGAPPPPGPPTAAHWLALAGVADAAGPPSGSLTLFFDEVADLPMPLQAMLEHLLEGLERGAAASTDLQVVAATSRDLRAEIAAGRFRSELYYRLSVFALHLPPLRERLEDLPDLAFAFLSQIGSRVGRAAPQLTGGATRALQALAWPGNLRELRNVLERASLLCDGGLVGESAVRAALSAAGTLPGVVPSTPAEPSSRLDDAQRAHVRAVLDGVHGNKSLAAARLGISRRALYRLLDRLDA